MPRTPLLRALRRLADDQRTADRLGIPVSELHERRTEDAAYDRGEFLKRAGAAGAGALAGSAYFAEHARAAKGGTNPRIAIIGGGIAGLDAALTLQHHNVYADVYESSNRVGGRMHSDWTEFGHNFWDNGQQAELCGELIDSGHKRILKLAQRFNLATVDLLAAQPAGTEDTNWIFGADYTPDQAAADFQPVSKVLKQQLKAAGYPTLYNSSTPTGQMLDQTSVHNWIANYVPGGLSSKFGTLLNSAYNEEYGAETTDQSSLNLVYLLGFQPDSGFNVLGQSDERHHIAGGNSSLPIAIANALPAGSVHLGYRMSSIALKSDGSIKVTFSNGASITADHVILCMSFSVLRTLDYSKAGFDQLKKTAITQLGSGHNAKLNVQFTSRLWNAQGSTGSLYTDLPLESGWDVTRGQSGATGILVEYPGANTATSLGQSNPYTTTANNPNVKKAVQSYLKQLEAIYPGISSRWNGKAMLSTPFTDPNLLCSYSYWRVGQYTGFSGYEGVRQGNIHFAGEHCSTDFQGFMEGGAREGHRAAKEIVTDLGIS
jgi:monoamine oxidase